MTSAKKYIITW